LRPRTRLIAIAIVVIGVVTGFGSAPAAGHEHVTLGTYELTVGWVAEPAVVGEAVVAWVLAEAVLEKFGGDTLGDLQGSIEAYRQRVHGEPR